MLNSLMVLNRGYFIFSSVCCYSSARLCSLTNLLVYAIKDYLVEFSYTALLAGEPNNSSSSRRVTQHLEQLNYPALLAGELTTLLAGVLHSTFNRVAKQHL